MREAPKVSKLVEIEKLVQLKKLELEFEKKDRVILLNINFPNENEFHLLIEQQKKYIDDFYFTLENKLLKNSTYTNEEKGSIKKHISELKTKELTDLGEKEKNLLIELRRLRAEQFLAKKLSGDIAKSMTNKPPKQPTKSYDIWAAAYEILSKLDKKQSTLRLPGLDFPAAYLESLNFFKNGYSDQLDPQDINYHFLNLRKIFREQQRINTNIEDLGEEISAERDEKKALEKISESELEKLIIEILTEGGVFRGKKDFIEDSNYINKLTEILKNTKQWKEIRSFILNHKPITVIAGSRTGDLIVMASYQNNISIKNFHFEIPFEFLPKKDQEKILEAKKVEFDQRITEENLRTIQQLQDLFLDSIGYENEEMANSFNDYVDAYLQYCEDSKIPEHDEETLKEDFYIASEKFKKYVSLAMNTRFNDLSGGKSIHDLTDEEKEKVFEGMPNILTLSFLNRTNESLYDIAPLAALEPGKDKVKGYSEFDFSYIENFIMIGEITPEGKKEDLEMAFFAWLGSKIEMNEGLKE